MENPFDQTAKRKTETVYNNPRSGSVDQVEKYLSGLEGYESISWGKVKIVHDRPGIFYTVYHEYKFIDDSGKRVVSSQTFYFSQAGSIERVE